MARYQRIKGKGWRQQETKKEEEGMSYLFAEVIPLRSNIINTLEVA